MQLHGSEPPKYTKLIKYPVIKCIRLKDTFDSGTAEKYPGIPLLLDTISSAAHGGTGEVFNWEIIPPAMRSRIILAGGISASNIEYIYRNIRPMAVDLSSSLEKAPGQKDSNKVIEFLNIINNIRKEH